MARIMDASPTKRLLSALLAVVLVVSSLGIAGIAHGTDKAKVHPLTEAGAAAAGSSDPAGDLGAAGDAASGTGTGSGTPGAPDDGSGAGANGSSGSTDPAVPLDPTGGASDGSTSPEGEAVVADKDAEEGIDPAANDTEGTEAEDDPEVADEESVEPTDGVFIDDVRYDVDDEGLLYFADKEEKQARVSVVSGNTTVFNDGAIHHMQIVNKTVKGFFRVGANTKLYLDGNGTIDVSGISSSVDGGRSAIIVEGAGAELFLNTDQATWPGDITIRGGAGTLVKAHGDYENDSNYTGGGAILVQRSARQVYGSCQASLVMGGGIIEGNQANAGGGIFIDRYCGFTMTGGKVVGNTAKKYEGGGIYIAGSYGGSDSTSGSYAYIAGGEIARNTTETTFSWGGGGIFVESKGVVKLASSLITDNTAGGLGGGVSGCPHAYIGVGKISGGAAIFGNSANYNGYNGKGGAPSNPALQCLKTNSADGGSVVYSGDMYAYGYYKDSNGYYNTSAQKGDWSKDYFSKNYATVAQDYYCTKSSIVEGSDMGQASGNAWIGYVAGSYSNEGYANGKNSFGNPVTIAKGNSYTAVDETLALTNTLPKGTRNGFTSGRAVSITDNVSYTHGGGIGCNGKLIIGDLSEGEETEPISFDLQKKFENDLGQDLPVADGQFSFKVFASDASWVRGAELGEYATDEIGRVTFQIPGDGLYPSKQVHLLIEEVDSGAPGVVHDGAVYGVVLDLEWAKSQFLWDADTVITRYTPAVMSKQFVRVSTDVQGNKVVEDMGADLAITNRLELRAENALGGNKYYYGGLSGDDAVFSFTMAGMSDPFAEGVDGGAALESLVRVSGEGSGTRPVVDDSSEYIYDDGEVQITLKAENGSYSENKAAFSFASINYEKPGSYYYLISEDSRQDEKVYVAKVVVSADELAGDSVLSLKAELIGLFAAPSAGSPIDEMIEIEVDRDTIDFHNMELVQGISLDGYLVSAASNTALEQRCLVDPKIYKKLVDASGKELTLKPDQFLFQLFEVNEDYTQIVGDKPISSTGNDAFGMVDFDAAANVSGDPDNPSCLEYNTAGTYHYRVYENPQYNRDPSVIYDDRIITFTTVIEHVNGALVCTDMYYGYLDENGDNQRYYESEDPTWHPTLTNKTMGMNLRVQKTSAADREQGLENAVYGLWMHNADKEGDIYMGSARSGEDGFIYFEDVNLSFGNWYYFLEEEAPDFHTVSRHRSMYFTLVNTDDGGIGLAYAESVGGELVDAAGEPIGGSASAASLRTAAFAVSPADAGADGAGGAGAGAGDAVSGLSADGVDGSGANDASARAVGAARDVDGNTLTYDYDNGVYDELTRVNISKLETHTHDFVEGAELAIIEKSTGRTVVSWTTGSQTEVISGKLNVGVHYILRELRVPEGYAKADDVVFFFDAYGNISVVSGDGDGNAEVIGDSISLYDTLLDLENVSYRSRTVGGGLTQTGDSALDGALMLLVVCIGAGALLAGSILLRRARKDK